MWTIPEIPFHLYGTIPTMSQRPEIQCHGTPMGQSERPSPCPGQWNNLELPFQVVRDNGTVRNQSISSCPGQWDNKKYIVFPHCPGQPHHRPVQSPRKTASLIRSMGNNIEIRSFPVRDKWDNKKDHASVTGQWDSQNVYSFIHCPGQSVRNTLSLSGTMGQSEIPSLSIVKCGTIRKTLSLSGTMGL